MASISSNNLSKKISDLLIEARQRVVQTVNHTMVLTYFEIGRMIVEEEQSGKERADYGKELIKNLSSNLSVEFGKGFSQRNLEQMRQFYLVYSKQQALSAKFKKTQTLSAELSNSQKGHKLSDEFKLSWKFPHS